MQKQFPACKRDMSIGVERQRNALNRASFR